VGLIADTSFLVGLWRRQRWAMEFATNHSVEVIGIPWVVLGEFWHGARRAAHDDAEVARFLGLGQPILETGRVIPHYAEICARLQTDNPEAYQHIGQNDLWIAAAAQSHARPLVTRNQRHFRTIAGLELVVLQEPPSGP
jgi:predicted nucleic acid-binding protein